MAKICVITTSRADYGLLYNLLVKLREHPQFDLQLIAGGMHLRAEYGNTVEDIIADGFEIAARVDMLADTTDTPEGVAVAMGRGIELFAREYRRLEPDLVVVFGDRFEMFSAACAAVPLNIPLAHIGGGETTAGSVDDLYRHAMSVLSKYHFVSLRQYKNELIRRGVDRGSIEVVGYPAIENIRNETCLTVPELERMLGTGLGENFFLVTLHPETRGEGNNLRKLEALLSAMDGLEAKFIFTAANADAGGREMNRRLEEYCRERDNALFYSNLGRRLYLSLLNKSLAVVGNSSSGIVETAFWGIPAVNLGSRQEGRIKGKNVLDVGFDAVAISNLLRDIAEGRVKRISGNSRYIFGRGDTSSRIVGCLEKVFIRE